MTAAEIKQIRKDAGLSAHLFGQAVGVTGRTVRRWEASKEPLDLRQSVVDKINAVKVMGDKARDGE